jgi:predicted enzyme related to lactoylglutathione lyase
MKLTPGQFGWADLSTTDVAAAKRFYTGLFGWEHEDVPTPMGPDYTMCRIDGQMIAGLGPMPPGMSAAGAPSTWNSYVIVEDVDASAAAAVEAGGSVVMPAMDIMTSGRMAMIAGPDGAALGLWQPIEHQGVDVFDVPGALTWNELQSRALEPAMAFYTQLFGWRWERGASARPYHVCHVDARTDRTANGGAMQMPDGVPPEAPSMWAVYFAVADCDATADRVARLGGELFLPTMEVEGNRFAGATDPTGAMFFLGEFVRPA